VRNQVVSTLVNNVTGTVSMQNKVFPATLSIRNIQEWNETSGVVAQSTIPNVTTSQFEITSYGNKWVCSMLLDNEANVSLTIYRLSKSFNFTIANTTYAFPPNVLKVNVKVQNWPFKSINHSLAIVFETQMASLPNGFTQNSSTYESGSLSWFAMNADSISLFGQFSPEASVDGRKRLVYFSMNSTDFSITAVSPHFWQEFEMDPSYSILVDDNNGNGGGVSQSVIIGTVVGVVGGMIVIILAVYVGRHVVLCHEIQKGNKTLEGETSTGGSSYDGDRL